MFQLKNDNGFSLIELVSVIVIIGVLASIVVPLYNTHLEEVRVNKIKSELRILKDALDSYCAVTGELPENNNKFHTNLSEGLILQEEFVGSHYTYFPDKTGYRIEYIGDRIFINQDGNFSN